MGRKIIRYEHMVTPKHNTAKVISFKDVNERERFINLYEDIIYSYSYDREEDEFEVKLYITLSKYDFDVIVKNLGLIPVDPPRTRYWRTEGARVN